MEKKKINSDIITGGLLVLLSIFVFMSSLAFHGDAKVYPIGLAIITFILSFNIILQGIRRSNENDSVDISAMKMPVFAYLIVTGYMIGFYFIGYFVSTPIFIIVIMRYLGVKDWKKCIITALGYTIVCYIGFVVLMKVPIYSVGITGGMFRWNLY